MNADHGLARSIFVDPRFSTEFAHLRQVFAYVTDQCSLRCTHCFYRPALTSKPREIPSDTLFGLLRAFVDLGAWKLSLLGGEPTLYGRRPPNAPIWEVVSEAHQIGFSYVRMVTNGLGPLSVYERLAKACLDELTVSLEGDTEEMNSLLRGRGTFARATRAIGAAREAGLPVQLTMSVHSGNLADDGTGRPLVERAIDWAQSLGITSMNLHPLIKMGVERDSWTGPYHIRPKEWVAAYERLTGVRRGASCSLPLRLPVRFVLPSTALADPTFYSWCPMRLGERVEIHPNGQIQSCALSNGTNRAAAHFTPTEIRWATENNERAVIAANGRDGCHAMRGEFSGFVPVCISLKPGQVELVGWGNVPNRCAVGAAAI